MMSTSNFPSEMTSGTPPNNVAMNPEYGDGDGPSHPNNQSPGMAHALGGVDRQDHETSLHNDKRYVSSEEHHQRLERISSGGNRRLYVGNISNEVTEVMLRDFFQENGMNVEAITKIILRNGYAFVEFHDSANALAAAEKCNMKTFLNTAIRVDAAERPNYRPRIVNRHGSARQSLVKNCTSATNLKELQAKFSQFGPVTIEQGHHAGSFIIHTSDPKQSDALISEFHGKMFGNTRLGVSSYPQFTGACDGSGDGYRIPPSIPYPFLNANSIGSDMDFPRGSSIPASACAAYQSMQAAADPPLKILIPTEFVGAVIGRGGATIRAISKGTGTRLDIFRSCSRYDVPEKPITIYGPPDKASKACRWILEIIVQELDNHPEHKGEVALRMFARASYIGRVIGKGGNIIKKIMDDTQTKIHISTPSDAMGKETSIASTNRNYVPPVVERLIAIRGSIDGICKAESIISEKLKQVRDQYDQNEIRMCSENGYGSNNPGMRVSARNSYDSAGGPGVPRTSYSSTGGRGGGGNGGGASSDDEYMRSNAVGRPNPRRSSRTPFTIRSSNPNVMGMSQYIPGGTYPTYPTGSAYLNSGAGIWTPDQQVSLSRPEYTNMYIPNDVVGALIGRKGSNIRHIIQQTGASVKIMEETLLIDDNPVRRVVINGVIESLFKTQYLIYDKVVEEGKAPANHQIDDICLTVEMSVPTDMVGRLIGKNGQNIRDIRKNFLCRVKFMTDPDETLPPCNMGETYVRITGNFNASLGAQKKIREMLNKAMTRFFHGVPSIMKRQDESDIQMTPNDSGHSQSNSSNEASMNVSTNIPVDQ